MAHTPPPRRWDPHTTLGIRDLTSPRACSGLTVKMLPCNYGIDQSERLRIEQLLRTMAARAPTDTLDDLQHLASLSLCSIHNENDKQKTANVEKWTDIILNLPSPSLRQQLYGQVDSAFSTPTIQADPFRTSTLRRTLPSAYDSPSSSSRYDELEALIRQLQDEVVALRQELGRTSKRLRQLEERPQVRAQEHQNGGGSSRI
jgi:hypothetical protein